MNIVIRPAQPDEIEVLLEFEQNLIKVERPFDHTIKTGNIHYYDLLELIKSPTAEVLVAVADDLLVGSGYAKVLPAEPFRTYKEYAYLGFMFVRPAYRGQGVNQKILNGLITWAKAHRITEIKLEVYEENEIAKKAYIKAGFKPSLLEMRLQV